LFRKFKHKDDDIAKLYQEYQQVVIDRVYVKPNDLSEFFLPIVNGIYHPELTKTPETPRIFVSKRPREAIEEGKDEESSKVIKVETISLTATTFDPIAREDLFIFKELVEDKVLDETMAESIVLEIPEKTRGLILSGFFTDNLYFMNEKYPDIAFWPGGIRPLQPPQCLFMNNLAKQPYVSNIKILQWSASRFFKDLDSSQCSVILESMSAMKNLTALDFSFSCMDEDTIVKLIGRIEAKTWPLQILSLRGSLKIGKSAANRFKSFFKTNKTLRYLDISNCKIGTTCVGNILNGLIENSTMEILLINELDILKDDSRMRVLKNIKKVYEKNQHIRVIQASFVYMSDWSGICELWENVKEMGKVRVKKNQCCWDAYGRLRDIALTLDLLKYINKD
jgi:hypothetical protein